MSKSADPLSRNFGSLRSHLREEGFKYLFDTAVVIAGILIAFSLDNWWEINQRASLSRSYAISLKSDLEQDMRMVRQIMGQMEESMLRIDSLANYTRHKTASEIRNLDLFPLAMGDNVYRPYTWNRVTIEDLKQSGALRDRGNEELSRRIAQYEAMTRHMEEDFKYDIHTREQVSSLSDAILNMNYSNFQALASDYGNPNRKLHELHFSASEAYRDASLDSLSLLTEDTRQIQAMVNGYLRLRFFLNTRVHYELPGLVRQAEDIISLLASRYPNE